jgi:hypothetical protein
VPEVKDSKSKENKEHIEYKREGFDQKGLQQYEAPEAQDSKRR